MARCSGHDQFEESTEEIAPLTEEEKKQRLDELREKMAEKKAKQAVLDKEEQKKNEVRRSFYSFFPSHPIYARLSLLPPHSLFCCASLLTPPAEN